jgi:hypothetical protein
MLQIGINDGKQVGVGLRPTVNDGASESSLTMPFENVHARIRSGTSACDVCGTIGAAIIDDDELAIYGSVRYGGTQAIQ